MEKESLNWLGELAIIHADGRATDGKYCMIELYATKEGSPPWHVHHREDEGFYVIEGELSFMVGNRTYKAQKGDFLLAPKDVPHTYMVENKGHARILMICSPAGFENCVRAMSTPVSSLVPPKPENVDTDFEKIKDIASEFGVEFVDPPMS